MSSSFTLKVTFKGSKAWFWLLMGLHSAYRVRGARAVFQTLTRSFSRKPWMNSKTSAICLLKTVTCLFPSFFWRQTNLTTDWKKLPNLLSSITSFKGLASIFFLSRRTCLNKSFNNIFSELGTQRLRLWSNKKCYMRLSEMKLSTFQQVLGS